MPFVYIVRCADDTLYTGWAVDVARRVAAHNGGKGAQYTRTRGPVTLVYSEEVATVGDALRRERAIKRYPRAKKLALCVPVELAQPVEPAQPVELAQPVKSAKPVKRRRKGT